MYFGNKAGIRTGKIIAAKIAITIEIIIAYIFNFLFDCPVESCGKIYLKRIN